MTLWKCCTQDVRKFGKLSSDHRTGKCVSIPIPNKGNAKQCSDYDRIALISHASKVMLKNLQTRLQQYVNHELPDVQAGFRKGRQTRDQIANICWFMEKSREFQKNIHFCFIDYAKAFNCVDHNKVWKILKEMVFPVVMYGCESWTVKKAECWRIDAFELWFWKRLLRVPWTARRSTQSILKEISPGSSLEGLMLKLKLQ